MPENSIRYCTHCGSLLPVGVSIAICTRCALIEAASVTATSTEEHPQQPKPGTLDGQGQGPGFESRIGRYKILEKLGEGGWGVVYVGEQQEPIRRRVAIKVIKLGMDTRAVVARFDAERQALAMMDHPNIAKVFDAGATDNGRPYFVMELVRGIRITDYCNQTNLSTRERLELFIQVCKAIQHAHQKGIIHRDIKPSNILVTLHDGVPVPKVIDFGIAKATEGRLTDMTVYTQLNQFVGTPAYMSPEQAEMTGLDIDTRSDIYSLGVMLYELLTDRTPFDARELLHSGLDAMRRMIREQEPARPSTRLATLKPDELTTAARRRGVAPSKLTNTVQGDLDWIVMRCLEKDRRRRYETATDLACDIQRHLSSEPVTARPPSKVYRLQKAWRRNRLVFASGAAVIGAMFLGTGLSAWQAAIATKAKQDAIQAKELEKEQRLIAQVERDKAQLAQREAQNARDAEKALRRDVEGHLYSANMNLAQQAWEQENIGRVHQILQETATAPDRGFEWFYWQQQMHREELTLLGHNAPICSVAFSPDGQKLVSGSEDGTAIVWETNLGKELFTIHGHSLHVQWVAQSPDDVRGEVFTPDDVHWVDFSPNGQRIATSSGPEIKLWDAATGSEVLAIKSDQAEMLSVAFSRDGRRIVTGSYDGVATVWDTTNGKRLAVLKGHTGPITTVAFAPNDERIYTASPRSESIKVWNAQTGTEVLNVRVADNRCVAFSADGQRILTGNVWGGVRILDSASGKDLFGAATYRGPVRAAGFSPDSQRIVTCGVDMLAKIWDTTNGTHLVSLKGHSDAINSITFSADGRRIATGGGDLTVKIWKADRGAEPATFNGGWASALFPAGRNVVTGSANGTTHGYNITNGRKVFALNGHSNYVLCASFSPNGQHLVTGSLDETAKVWDVASGTELHTLKGHRGMVQSAAFSPDGQRIVTGATVDKTGRIWEVASGKLLLVVNAESGVCSVAFSPDGQRILTGSDFPAKVWDANTGRHLATLKGQSQCVAYSPDGRRIVVGDIGGMVRVWDAASYKPLFSFKAHSALIWCVTYSPDGQRILTGSWDNTAKIWESTSGKELLTLKGHSNAVYTASFSPDGLRIVTGGWDQTARVWEAASASQVEQWRKDDIENRARLKVWRETRSQSTGF